LQATAAGPLTGRLFSVRCQRCLAAGGSHQDRAWRVLEDAQGDAAEQPRGERATAWEAEHDQVGAPFGGVGDDLAGGPVDQGGADLAGGLDARHVQLEDRGLDDAGGGGVGLEREAPAAVALAEVEVQDEGLAGAGPAGHLHRVLGLGRVLDGDEHPAVGRRGGGAGLAGRPGAGHRPGVGVTHDGYSFALPFRPGCAGTGLTSASKLKQMSRISYFLTAVLYAGGRRWRRPPHVPGTGSGQPAPGVWLPVWRSL